MSEGGQRPARQRGPRELPDWAAVAALVADEQQKPVFLFDGEGYVRLANRLGLEFLGAPRDQIVGRHLDQLLLHLGNMDRFREALRGAVRRTEREVRTPDGRQLRVLLDLSPVGHGRRRGLLVTVLTSTPVHGEELPDDLEYEISADLSDFGRLQHIVASGRRVPYLAGRLCYEAIRRSKTACRDCPALLPGGEWPHVSVRRATPGGYEVVEATLHGRLSVRIKVRRFTGEMLAAVFDARIAELAEQADLTEREHGVLKYLIMGRQLSDIATILGVSARTVKFHQGNILRKLGADSRLDLMRFMM